jgi:hypothetical protein
MSSVVRQTVWSFKANSPVASISGTVVKRICSTLICDAVLRTTRAQLNYQVRTQAVQRAGEPRAKPQAGERAREIRARVNPAASLVRPEPLRCCSPAPGHHEGAIGGP